MDTPRPDTPRPGPPTNEECWCHECLHDFVWNRQEQPTEAPTCPLCLSDFVEIIEANHDPREEQYIEDDDGTPDLESMHDHNDRHNNDDNPFHRHNPWQDVPDPDEDDLNRFRVRQTGPDSFTLSGTFTHTHNTALHGGVPGGNGAPGPPRTIADNFTNMLAGILGSGTGQANPRPGSQQRQQPGSPPVPPRPDHFPPLGRLAPDGPGFHQSNLRTGGPAFTVMGGGPNHRFQYTRNARIFPRNANQAQPEVGPMDDLHQMIQQILSPGISDNYLPGQVPPGQRFAHQHNANAFPDNPFLGLLSALLTSPGGQMGDYAHSQQELDRIISRLMEQNASGSGPGPASEAAIAALPKKEVSKDMLGTEGNAECSICMDEVHLGEQVTVLPCSHWFHGQCVGAWLGEHDTCPHCRKGISPTEQGPSTPTSPRNATRARSSTSSPEYLGESSPPSLQPWLPRPTPGAFPTAQSPTQTSVFGSGTRNDLIRTDEARPQSNRHSSHGSDNSRRHSTSSLRNIGSSSSNNGSGGGGGIADRIRRGLFGSSARRQSGGPNH